MGSDIEFELAHGVWVESCLSKEQESERGSGLDPGTPKIRTMEAPFGYVSFYIGDVVKKESPQITNMEVPKKLRGSGYGERLVLLVVEYLSTSNDPSIREAFECGGIGTSWDMSHGFWERMAAKYGGDRSGRRGIWFQGDWGFPPTSFPRTVKPGPLMQAGVKLHAKRKIR